MDALAEAQKQYDNSLLVMGGLSSKISKTSREVKKHDQSHMALVAELTEQNEIQLSKIKQQHDEHVVKLIADNDAKVAAVKEDFTIQLKKLTLELEEKGVEHQRQMIK